MFGCKVECVLVLKLMCLFLLVSFSSVFILVFVLKKLIVELVLF